MAHLASDVGAAITGATAGAMVGAVGGSFFAGVGSAVGALVGAVIGGIEGVIANETVASAQDTADRVKADVSTQSVTKPSSGDGTGDGTSVNEGGTPDSPTALAPADSNSNPDVTQLDLAQEQWAEYNLQISSLKQQIGTQVLGMKAQEAAAESGIRAATASRGLRLSGSPLVQMNLQESAAKQGIGFVEQGGYSSVAGEVMAQTLAADKFRWSAKEQIQQADTAVTDAWLNAFAGIVKTGENLLTMNYPSSLFPSSPAASGSYDYPSSSYVGGSAGYR